LTNKKNSDRKRVFIKWVSIFFSLTPWSDRMPLDAQKLKNEMNRRHVTDERLANDLKDLGYDPGMRVVRSWLKKGLQPPHERLSLIAEALDVSVERISQDSPRRRNYGIGGRNDRQSA